MNRTHYKKVDFRIESLRLTIFGLEKSILELKKKLTEIDWYDGLWFLEEVEPIVGLAYIALQNYINSSIYDRFGTLDRPYEKYKLGDFINNSRRTNIELIVSLANYYKHRDDHQTLRSGTTKILSDCNLRFDKEIDITDSPILKGLNFFTEIWNFSDLVEDVVKWRNKLYLEEKNQLY